MQFPDEVIEESQKRLRRIEGQIRGIQRMLDDGKDCREIVTQLTAASAALDRVGFKLMAAGMRYCLTDPDAGMTPDEMEALFLKLA